MMDTLEAIRTRRSTRKFQERPVERALLDQIVEAGRYAPSGGNCQNTHFFVITDAAALSELSDLVKSEFAQMEITPNMYRSLVHSITASKGGSYVFHYNPPALIVTANKANYGNNIADCSCALENMMLAANALDLGSCWINQLRWLNEHEAVLAYFRRFGLQEDERIYGAVSIGYAATEDGMPERKPLARTGYPVTFID